MVSQTQNLQEEMLAITIKNQTTKKIIVWGIGDFKNDREDVTYVNCSNEVELLESSCRSGLNTIQMLSLVGILSSLIFLILINRVTKVLGEDKNERVFSLGFD